MSKSNSLPTPPCDEVVGPLVSHFDCIVHSELIPLEDIAEIQPDKRTQSDEGADFLTESLTFLNKSLNSSDDTGVDDFTNFHQFWESFLKLNVVAVNLAIRSIGLFVTLFVFFLIGMLFQPFIILSVILYRSILKRVSDTPYRSAVNSLDPNFHSNFVIKLKEQDHWRTVVDKLTNPPSDFDFDLAEFHLQLAALVYEPSSIVKEILAEWAKVLDISYKGFGSMESGSKGRWTVVVWSVKHNFVEIIFKGTGPYDLTEWLADCTMQKRPAKNGVLPGLVHAGFYDAFGFPDTEVYDNCKNNFCSELKKIRNKFEDCPNLWITGHSLGAAMATVFTSILLWRESPLGKNSIIQDLDFENHFKLRGTYTYGNPRVGNKNWKDAIEHYKCNWPAMYKFYRVINANDIVCSVPFGGFDSLPFGKFLASTEDGIADFWHLGEPIYLPFRFGKYVKGERELGFIFKNLFLEFATTPREFFRSKTLRAKLLTLLNGVTCGMIGFIGDHAPCEYLTNLQAAKLNDETFIAKVPAFSKTRS